MDYLKKEQNVEKEPIFKEEKAQEVRSSRVKNMTSFFEEEIKRQERVDQGHALREKLQENMVMEENTFSETMIPMDQVLKNEYQEEYREKSLVKSRESKIKNKKSRLYAKDQVAKSFEAAEKKEFALRDKRAGMRRKLSKEQRLELKVEELTDLSVLATELAGDETKTEDKFKELTEKYTGVSADGKTRKTSSQVKDGRFEIMTQVANILMSTKFVENFNIFDDKQLSANQEMLEKNSRMLKIFTDLTKQNPEFMESLKTKERDSDAAAGGDTAQKLETQIERLRAVDDVYRVRKLIVTNPYYKTHYNDELSMNAEMNDHPEKKYLSKLLRTQYYLGKNLQKVMGGGAGAEFPRGVLADGTVYMKKFERKVRNLSKSSKEYDRKNVDQMLMYLEHEKGCIPDSDMLFNLDNITQKKPKSMKHVMGSNPGKQGSESMLDMAEKKILSPEQVKREQIIDKAMNPYITHPIGVKSPNLHDHVGGDNLARQTKNFTGTLCGSLTNEEVAEMIENMMYSHSLKEPTEKEQAMADDMYVNGYHKYTNLMHQKMKMAMNVLGDKGESLRPEDWIRVMADPKLSDLMILTIATSSNMDINAPYDFLKKYSDLPVEHLKDFDLLSKATSSLAFKSDFFRSHILNELDSVPGYNDFDQETMEKLRAANKEAEDKQKANAPQEEIEAAHKKWGQASAGQKSVRERFTVKKCKTFEDFLNMKLFSKETKADVVNSIQNDNPSQHMDFMLGGYMALKKSEYWDYGTTSEEAQKAYQEKCDKMGYVKLDMDVKKYPEKEVKWAFKSKLSSLRTFGANVKKYDLKDAEALKDTLKNLKAVWVDLGYKPEEFDKMIKDGGVEV